MGLVYKANDSLLNIAVAIKKLHHDDSHDAIVRFQNEAVALGKLNHPNIARILDFANDANSLYMVMEYLKGRSLGEVIKKEGLSPAEAIQIFIEIAEAMIHAHKQGVLHRDLKPSNIILVELEDGTSVPKIVDFGIAKMRARDQHLTATGVGIGSPLYMSPEQARNDNVDERSDIYSFGCLMFEALIGRPPLCGDNALETIQKQINERPPRVDELTDTLGSYNGLVELIDRCLEKEPANRPQNFSQVRDELVDVQTGGEHPQEDSLDDIQRNESPRRSTKKTFALISVISVILIGIAIGLIYRINQKGEKEKPMHITESHKNLDFPPDLLEKKSKKIGPSINLENGILQCTGTIDDSALIPLSSNRLKTLKVVNVNQNSSTDGGGFQYLEESPIQTISINRANFDDRALKHISKIASLETLVVHEMPNISDAGLQLLSKLHGLKQLAVKRCKSIGNSGLSVVAKLDKLETLNLEGEQFTDGVMDYLESNKHLNRVILSRTNISSARLSKFVLQHPRLTLLSVNRQKLGDELFDAIGRSEIPELNLGFTSINQKQLELLSNAKHLSSLRIDGSSIHTKVIGQKVFCPLEKCKTLRALTVLNMDDAPDQVIDAIVQLNVRLLRFDNCTLTDGQLLRLAGMKALERLVFDKTVDWPESELDQFKKLFKSNWHRDCRISTSNND